MNPKRVKYGKRPDDKERMKAYFKAYYQRPEIKARINEHMKAYYQKPEPRKKRLEYMKIYNKTYLDHPGVRERVYAQHRDWLRRKRRKTGR